MTETRSQDISQTPFQQESNNLKLNDKLALIALIDEGMRLGTVESPVAADLFDNLWTLVNATVSGSRIRRIKPENTQNGFRTFEINAETGETLGRLNMLYLRKPIPCYYLVYVEVAAPFRRKGLGHKIIRYFGEFLAGKSAVGILDNIIPEDDPTFDIYLKNCWKSMASIVGDSFLNEDENYMVYIPPALKDKSLKESVLKLLHHLKRKRTAIDMRDNEMMVRRTLGEFKELYQTLLTYFTPEIKRGVFSDFTRFMFTRFVTKFIAFRRRIGNLVGYTGGESTEQITLPPEIARLPVKSYAPRELGKKTTLAFGEHSQLSKLPQDLQTEPARVIESLPNYRRPSFMAWLKEHGKSDKDILTIGDLMDLGFDPTRLKEITLAGEDYIFERVQARQVPEFNKKNELLGNIVSKMPTEKVRSAWLKTNPIILAFKDRGNAYLLRRKVPGIHWEEALEQLQSDSSLKVLNASMRFDKMILTTVREAYEIIAQQLGLEKEVLLDQLTTFVSWDLNNNRPQMIIDFAGNYLESIWMA
ncbi:MAG: hypothetical protein JW932_08350 [Deltaproteobacteria bacterium]|nr:hypothetical protein [Deltaproteobacteria bacterium]